MAVLAECPICHTQQATRNKVCKCGENMDKAYGDAILGHESQDMDRHYLHPDFEKDLRAAMEKYHSRLEGEITNVTHLVTQEVISA